MVAAMHFAFVATCAHVAGQPRKNDEEDDGENETHADDPRAEAWVALKPGKVEHSQDGEDQRDKPATAHSEFEVDAKVSYGMFGSHRFTFCADLLFAYTCWLNGFSGRVEKTASTGNAKKSAI